MEIKKIYFDLDGVMADFERGVFELCGLDPFSHEDDHVAGFVQNAQILQESG